MIPGQISRLSKENFVAATTIGPIHRETLIIAGTTQIETILPPDGGQFGFYALLVPVDGDVVLGTSGNILVGVTAPQNRTTHLTWVASLGKWCINSGA